jgi:hypothetical protein
MPRPIRKKRVEEEGIPLWAKAVIAGTILIVLLVGGFFGVYFLMGSRTNPLAADGGTSGDIVSRLGGDTTYVPRVSEQKLQDYMKGREHEALTEEQVYAIMGEPTHREPAVTVRKNGQVITAYTAHWAVRGSGVWSQITFANGRLGGMILGLEVTPGEEGGRN